MADLKLTALEMAVAALEEGFQEYQQYPHLLTVRDGIIQRFEIAMDLSRQIMVRVLKEMFNYEEALAKKETFREAAKLALITDVEAWLAHLAARNRTAHTDDSAIAAQVFEPIPSLLPAAHDLLRRLNAYAA